MLTYYYPILWEGFRKTTPNCQRNTIKYSIRFLIDQNLNKNKNFQQIFTTALTTLFSLIHQIR